MNFADRLAQAILARRTPGVVGIDPVIEKLPAALRERAGTLSGACDAIERFSREVVDAVAEIVPAVKINIAFFEPFYESGIAAYRRLVAHAHAAGLLVIGDIKRGDIGSTAKLYARGHLAPPAFTGLDPTSVPDAVTLAGYLGRDAIAPFIEIARAEGRGVFVLVRPSDPGADEVHEFGGGGEKFYQHMGRLVRSWGEQPGLIGECGLSCVGAVVAPKDAASTAALRAAMPTTPFLVPGYGAQGADAEACRPCFLAGGRGAVINASRSVIYAFDAAKYREHHGDAWAACVRDAARDFAADVSRFI